MQKLLGVMMVAAGLSGVAMPAFSQTDSTNASNSPAVATNSAEIAQLQGQIKSLKAQQASVSPGSTQAAELQGQINGLQTRVAHLQGNNHRVEKNTHMLKEMGVNG
jgi:TolA-binding protein